MNTCISIRVSFIFVEIFISQSLIIILFLVRTTPGGPWRSVQHSSDLTPAERASLLPFRFSHPLLMDITEGGDNVPVVLDAVIPEVINLALGDDAAQDGGGEEQEGGAVAGQGDQGDDAGPGEGDQGDGALE